MARMKTMAVTVSYTVQHTVYVEARRPNGAVEKVLSHEGWREAIRYRGDEGLPFSLPKDAVVTDVRVIS